MSKLCRMLLLISSSITMAGCATTADPCAGFKIITAHRDDTAQTKREILEHDLTYQKVCE